MRALFLTVLLAGAGAALAQETMPDALVRSITDDVVATVKRDQAIQAGDSGRLAELVEARILPHFDFRRTTQIAMGAYWRHATPEQQEQLTREFRTLLVRTYSGALASYRDQAIEVRPLRMRPGDTEVTVRSLVRQAGAEPVQIEYDMERTASDWKVFDVRVSGISLVATYRTSFAEEVRNHGIDGLIQALAAKNRSAVRVSSRT
ncbi:MAG TPA: ABC transporter substrate-binding protein [Burkholderiales bacterium]|nr:ABC transporter substrate-binding protein [Burkholderiales bacterium]